MPEIQNISWLYSSLYNFFSCGVTSAQFPCTVLLDPECMTSSCTSSHHPCHQVCDFWNRISFLILDVMRHLPALRIPEYCPLPEHEFLGSDACSGHLDSNHMLCSALIPCGTLGTLGWLPQIRPAMGDQTNSTLKKSINWHLNIVLW